MNNKFVFCCLLIAVIAASVLHQRKSSESNEEKNIDDLAEGLKGIESLLPVTTDFSLRLAPANTTAYLWCRYLLAPRYCSMDPKDNYDTVLSVCDIGKADSMAAGFTGNSKIIWQN